MQEESLELVFQVLPPGSSRSAKDVTETIGTALAERGVEVGNEPMTISLTQKFDLLRAEHMKNSVWHDRTNASPRMQPLGKVVFMGCYGRRGPRVSQFGTVANWALEHTSYQASTFKRSTVARK